MIAKILRLLWKWLVIPLLGLVIILIAGWSVCAIYFAKSPSKTIRIIAVLVFIISNLAVFINVKKTRFFLIFFTASFCTVLIWWALIPPSNNRNWAEQTAVLPYAVFSNNFVTIHNIRNFDYKSEKDFTTNYYTKTYNLDNLKKLFLVVSYWDKNRAIAHTMLDFQFESGDCVVLSVEVRREKGEEYSAFKGLFKMNEIIYVLADERDVIRLRTNFTHEDVYLYPLKYPKEKTKKLFINILEKVNSLKNKPEFYNAITENCTLSLIHHFAAVENNKPHFYLAYLLNGFLDWRLYENGTIDTDLPAKEAKRAYYISDIAKNIKDTSDFSKKIRMQLPETKTKKSTSVLRKITTSAKKNIRDEIDNLKSFNKSSKTNVIGNTVWYKDFSEMSYDFGKLKGRYPDNLIKGNFPPAGAKPVFITEKKWPDVFINAKWTLDISKLSSEKKENILDEILLRACNPNYYKSDFPETIVKTKFETPDAFSNELADPSFDLINAMRGKSLNYEVVMNAGFGARDYTIKTKIYIGATDDRNTIFYYDKPENISNHLDIREFTFAARKTDDKLFFEVNIFCKCEPSSILRGTKMNRVAADSKYFIMQMFKHLSDN